MEVRKVNGFFIIFVIGYIGLSVVCASIMAYAQNSGIAVSDWIQYVMSEGIILLIAIIYDCPEDRSYQGDSIQKNRHS